MYLVDVDDIGIEIAQRSLQARSDALRSTIFSHRAQVAVDEHLEHRLAVVGIPAETALGEELHAIPSTRESSSEYPLRFACTVERCRVERRHAVVNGAVDQTSARNVAQVRKRHCTEDDSREIAR
jgi:hypothetical protein